MEPLHELMSYLQWTKLKISVNPYKLHETVLKQHYVISPPLNDHFYDPCQRQW